MSSIDMNLNNQQTFSVNPKKFTLWLFLITVTMFFGGLTSALIVRSADIGWDTFEYPSIFMVSTILIAISSVSMQWSYYSATKNNLVSVKSGLWLTFILGVAFIICQCIGYKILTNNNIYLTGPHPSQLAGFFYVLSGLHFVHILAGIIVILFSIVHTYKYKVHSKNLLRINMCTTYWHFMGGLWVYLFFLLNYVKQ